MTSNPQPNPNPAADVSALDRLRRSETPTSCRRNFGVLQRHHPHSFRVARHRYRSGSGPWIGLPGGPNSMLVR